MRSRTFNILARCSKTFGTGSVVNIASISGRARGLGNEFIQAFDMHFASKEKTFFAQPEIGISFIPDGGLERLRLLTEKARALEIILSDDDYGAQTASDYGWINRTFSESDCDTFVENLVRRIDSFDKKLLQ